MSQAAIIKQRLEALENRITRACSRAGRRRQEITLVAVTKTVPVQVAALLPELGLKDLGENRPQQLWSKAEVLPQGIHWHLIGHLQRNKIERTLPLAHMVHSVDSLRLLQSLDQEANKQGRAVAVLLEVNASREPNKHGFAPEELAGLIPAINNLRLVQIHGLMTMAAFADNPEHCRPTFAEVRRLRDQLAVNLAPPHSMSELSMGMSNDFEIAIEEGATLVRIGTVLLEGIKEE